MGLGYAEEGGRERSGHQGAGSQECGEGQRRQTHSTVDGDDVRGGGVEGSSQGEGRVAFLDLQGADLGSHVEGGLGLSLSLFQEADSVESIHTRTGSGSGRGGCGRGSSSSGSAAGCWGFSLLK